MTEFTEFNVPQRVPAPRCRGGLERGAADPGRVKRQHMPTQPLPPTRATGNELRRARG